MCRSITGEDQPSQRSLDSSPSIYSQVDNTSLTTIAHLSLLFQALANSLGFFLNSSPPNVIYLNYEESAIVVEFRMPLSPRERQNIGLLAT